MSYHGVAFHSPCIEHRAHHALIFRVVGVIKHSHRLKGWDRQQRNLQAIAQTFGGTHSDKQTRVTARARRHTHCVQLRRFHTDFGKHLVDENGQQRRVCIRLVGTARRNNLPVSGYCGRTNFGSGLKQQYRHDRLDFSAYRLFQHPDEPWRRNGNRNQSNVQ